MQRTTNAELREQALRLAQPEPPPLPAQRWNGPTAIRRFFEVRTVENGVAMDLAARRLETESEAREHAAKRALALGVGVVELLPWERWPADIENGVVIQHRCYDQCSGQFVNDAAELRGLYPHGA